MDEGEIDRVCAVWPDAEFKKLPKYFQKLSKYYPKQFFTLIDNFINSQKVQKSFWATFESEFVDNVYKEKSFVLEIEKFGWKGQCDNIWRNFDTSVKILNYLAI